MHPDFLPRLFNLTLVSILLDEVKSKKAGKFPISPIIWVAVNNSGELASSSLVIEFNCHHGGPRLVIRIIPVMLKWKAIMKEFLLEFSRKARRQHRVNFVCDNCPLN